MPNKHVSTGCRKEILSGAVRHVAFRGVSEKGKHTCIHASSFAARFFSSSLFSWRHNAKCHKISGLENFDLLFNNFASLQF